MHTASIAVHHSRNEKLNRSSHDFVRTIRLFLNKTTFELGILGIICGAVLTIVIHHPYFQITDIKIEGLDTYAAEIAKRTISHVQHDSFYGIPANNYVFLQVAQIEKLLQERIALDNVELTKRFPHTLVVRAVEREVAFLVVGTNGTAYIADDGSLVRWYDKNQNVDPANFVALTLSGDVQSKGLREQVLDQSVVQRLNIIANASSGLHRGALASVDLESESDTVGLRFATDLTVSLRLDADIDIQMQKAKLSSAKFPTAKKIDVRFADKVFVTF